MNFDEVTNKLSEVLNESYVGYDTDTNATVYEYKIIVTSPTHDDTINDDIRIKIEAAAEMALEQYGVTVSVEDI